MTHADLPLPPELAAPDADADAWVERVAIELVLLADDDGLTPAEAAVQVADTFPAYDNPTAPPWTVTDDGSAEWAMRHVVMASAEVEQLRDQADAWAERIEQWFSHRAKYLIAKVVFMEAHLERYAKARRDADPKAKTLVLPSGVVKTTSQAPKVKVVDEHAALVWAEANAPSAIARDPRLRLGELRKAVEPRQLVTEAEVTLSCGCRYTDIDRDSGLTYPQLGSELACETCGPALLGRVDVRATRWVLSVPVPGLDVDPGGVSAKVVPAP